ncbi:MAG: UvrD-helicase domain-containing protein [Thermoleophilaceae bacterium]
MDFTDEQLRAIGRREGPLLVRAGAGTGKTSVLVERFVRAVIDDGAPLESILAITFTDKAAAQLGSRIRARFLELGRREEARAAEGAWISTIHGFCSRVLRAHALRAGIDPEYRVLGELETERVGLDAFDGALADFLEGAGAERLELVAAYTPDKLRAMVRTAYSRLRSRGERRPSLPEVRAPEPSTGAAARAELLAVASRALAELGAAGSGKQVEEALALLEGCAEALGDSPSHHPRDVEALRVKGGAKALKGSACEAYERARAAYEEWCALSRSAGDHALLRELLALYGDRYDELKRARSGIDFEDLELIARDVLEGDAGIREQYAGRFSHVLVDEFQDVNRLQNALLELISRDNLFRVGDEHQSIYGFRNADVGVFREHQERARGEGSVESLTANFRSRPELIDAIDMAFEDLWGADFEPLREPPGPRRRKALGEPAVELLVTDRGRQRFDATFAGREEPFGAGMRSVAHWRAAEARLLAKRVQELAGSGGWSYRDVVLLLRATTHMSVYERALEERGVPTHVVGGRGYWSQQQVGDLRHWLAALANPRDELAIFSLLASPFVGASLDAVAIVGLRRRRLARDVWWTLTQAFLPDGDGSDDLEARLPEADRERIGRFVRLFDAERRAAPRVSLERLVDRAVTSTGYDRRILALPAGERRMANVRKLMRMAREYEADEGRDLRGFIDFVAERDLIQEREGEAPLEAEELDAVRLMTVHRAKGLEFPVVCVADLGKLGREDYGGLRISDDGRLGLRLASLGGGSVDSAEMRRIRDEQRLADEQEERRIFYVAITRAQERLVLSGATDLEKRPGPAPLEEPMRWIWRRFCPGLPAEGASGVSPGAWNGREVRVRWTRCAPDTLDELLPASDRDPLRPEPTAPAKLEATPPLALGGVSAPRALPVSRLSYSGLQAYKRCGYRFYLERALRLPGADSLRLGGGGAPGVQAKLDLAAGPELGETDAREPRAADELPALLRGTIVHELLERLDFARPAVPSAKAVAELIEQHGVAEPGERDVAGVRGLIEAFCDSPLRERIAGAERVRTEQPFAFPLELPESPGRSLLVNGFLDVHAVEPDRTLIVDYKSDPLDGRDPTAVCDEKYATQRVVYALAALRGRAARVEVAHLFLERADEPVLSVFEAAQTGDLERELLELARGVVEARFAPTEHPHRELCADCPGQPALCSWGPEHTLAAG